MKLRFSSDYFNAEIESVGKEGPPWKCSGVTQYMTTWTLHKILKRCIEFRWRFELIP